MGDQYILRAVSGGAVHETELTAEQALKLSACQAVAYFPRDERVRVDPATGRVVYRESARLIVA